MSLFFALLPVYLFGNVHCLGMCGPLVMMIGQHPHRHFYFFGRLLSYSLVGGLAGALGAVLQVILKEYHLSEILSLTVGAFLLWLGTLYLIGKPLKFIFKPLAKCNRLLSTLLLKESRWATFLFGFFTVALPCGQTLIVFSACALMGSFSIGLLNGFALALLTTPSLLLALYTLNWLKNLRNYYNLILGFSSLLVGLLSLCRGFAEMGWISHWILNPHSSNLFHVVIF